jgi:hypothetical protein
VAFGPTKVKFPISEDWAILRLNQGVGDRLGFLPLSTEVDSRTAEDVISGVILPGHSGDLDSGSHRLNLPAHRNCRIVQRATLGVFVHDCDMTTGASGSPLILCDSDGVECRVVALNSGQYRVVVNRPDVQRVEEFSPRVANLAISIIPILGELDRLKSE